MRKWKLQLLREDIPRHWRPTYAGGRDWRSLRWWGLTLELLWWD